MSTNNIVFKIEAVTNQNVMEAYGEQLKELIGTYDQWIEGSKQADAEIKKLNATLKQNGQITNDEARQLGEAKARRQQYQQLIKQEDKINTSLNGSLKQQQLVLSKVNTALRNATDEYKKAHPELIKFQKDFHASVKGMNAEMGNFQMNVGNYPQLISQLSAQVPALNSVAGGFMGIATAANPIGGAIVAIGLAIKGVTMAFEAYNEAIEGSQRLTYELKDAMISLDASNDAITRSLQNSASGYIQLKGAVSTFWGWYKQYWVANLDSMYDLHIGRFQKLFEGDFKGFIRDSFAPINSMLNLGESAEDYKEVKNLLEQIVPKQLELEKLKEGSVVRLAEIEKDAAEAQLIAREKDKYSAEERMAAVERYEALMKERTSILNQQAQLESEILILEGERTDNTHEVNMAIEEGKAKLVQLEAQEANALRAVVKLRTSIQNELEKEVKTAKKATTTTLIDPLTRYDYNTKNKMRDSVTAAMDDIAAIMEEEVPKLEPVKIKGEKVSPLAKLIGVSNDELQTIKGKAEQAAQQIFGSIQQISQQSTQQRLDQELRAIDSAAESEKAILQSKLDKKRISQEQYEQKLAAIEEEAEEKREQANKDTFAKNKIWNLAQAAMNMALAITNIWATNKGGMAARIAETALASAAGVAQIAVIAAQKYARGGELHGASHAQGGIKGNVQGHNIEMEGGEIIINKYSAREHRKLLSWINSENGWGVDFAGVRGSGGYSPNFKFAKGGVLSSFDFSPSATPQSSSFQQAISRQADRVEELIYAINRRIDRLQVMVNISDIENASNTKQVHINRASL